MVCHEESSSQAVSTIIGPTIKSHRRVEILPLASVSVPYSGKPKECCGGAAVEQEKLQRICPSAFGALTPGLGLLVLLSLVPEVDNGCDDEVR